MEVKFKYVLLALCSLATVISCRKMHEETQAVNIDVSTEYQVYKIGEPVSFKIDSNADFLTFYSGEEGSKYEYHDVNRVVDAGIALSFMTSTSSGLAGSPNPSILPVSYSNDFSGIYTEEEMAKATWIDITERFNFPEDTGISDCKSGNVDISDLFESDDRALYFRFEYTVQAYEAGLKNSRTQWIVNSLAFNILYDGTYSELYSLADAQWTLINDSKFAEVSKTIPDNNGSRIRFRSDNSPAETITSWAVSGPIAIQRKYDYGPDRGVCIRTYTDPKKNEYIYRYDECGEYTVTFVGVNENVYDRKSDVAHVKIKVIDEQGVIENPQEGEWIENK